MGCREALWFRHHEGQTLDLLPSGNTIWSHIWLFNCIVVAYKSIKSNSWNYFFITMLNPVYPKHYPFNMRSYYKIIELFDILFFPPSLRDPMWISPLGHISRNQPQFRGSKATCGWWLPYWTDSSWHPNCGRSMLNEYPPPFSRPLFPYFWVWELDNLLDFNGSSSSSCPWTFTAKTEMNG